jgi:hypothetical protein
LGSEECQHEEVGFQYQIDNSEVAVVYRNEDMVADPNRPPDRYAVYFPKTGTNAEGRFISPYSALQETL